MTTRVADPKADELAWPDGVEVEALLKTVLADAHGPLDPDDDVLDGAAALAGGVDAADGNGVSGTAIVAGAVGRPPACSAPALASSSGAGSGTAACAD